ncbi:alpha-amylase, partial [Leptolyngbya cf. ectocarpi LEGE 11479]
GVLIVSPVYVNEYSGYHGYHPIHLLMVDPRLGTLQKLQALVAEAHDLDIAVILDVVVNHLADNIDWEEYGGPSGGEFKYVRGDSAAVMPFPVETRNTLLFHGPEYTDMVNQRLFGFLEDWRTESSHVRSLLIDHLKYWLAVTNVDGFRYDSARHVGVDFWQPCVAEISRYARYLGKTDFLQIAEHAGSSHGELTAYNGANFSGFLDYPTHYSLKHALGNGEWLGGFADYFCGRLAPGSTYAAGWRNNLMFLDNQDTTRIFHEFLVRHSDRAKATSCLHFALACSILGPQRPAIYAGTEQEFSGALGMHQREDTGEWIGHDCHVREDMFDNPACVWKFGPINRKVFQPYNQEHETFQLIHTLADMRRQMVNIQTCDRTILIAKDHGLRCVLLHDAQGTPPLLVVMNLGTQHLIETDIPIPESHGKIIDLKLRVTTAGGTLEWIDQRLKAQLPPFAFVLGQLETYPWPLSREPWYSLKQQDWAVSREEAISF